MEQQLVKYAHKSFFYFGDHMRFTVLSIVFIVVIVLVAGAFIGQRPVNLTGASLTYPSLSGYCRQTVDPVTGVGAFVCDSSRQVVSVVEGSLRKPGQVPLFVRSGGSTFMTFNPQRRCGDFACDQASPPLIYSRLPYSRAPSLGMFSQKRWCNRDPDRCFVFAPEQSYRLVYLQGSPYNWRRAFG